MVKETYDAAAPSALQGTGDTTADQIWVCQKWESGAKSLLAIVAKQQRHEKGGKKCNFNTTPYKNLVWISLLSNGLDALGFSTLAQLFKYITTHRRHQRNSFTN